MCVCVCLCLYSGDNVCTGHLYFMCCVCTYRHTFPSLHESIIKYTCIHAYTTKHSDHAYAHIHTQRQKFQNPSPSQLWGIEPATLSQTSLSKVIPFSRGGLDQRMSGQHLTISRGSSELVTSPQRVPFTRVIDMPGLMRQGLATDLHMLQQRGCVPVREFSWTTCQRIDAPIERIPPMEDGFTSGNDHCDPDVHVPENVEESNLSRERPALFGRLASCELGTFGPIPEMFEGPREYCVCLDLCVCVPVCVYVCNIYIYIYIYICILPSRTSDSRQA